SHAAALKSTALQTEEMLGVAWGGGLYLNYAFAVVWIADSIWSWRGMERYETRHRLVEWFIQGFLGFMAFNGTVVFASGAVRWVATGAGLALVAAWLIAGRHRTIRSTAAEHESERADD